MIIHNNHYNKIVINKYLVKLLLLIVKFHIKMKIIMHQKKNILEIENPPLKLYKIINHFIISIKNRLYIEVLIKILKK